MSDKIKFNFPEPSVRANLEEMSSHGTNENRVFKAQWHRSGKTSWQIHQLLAQAIQKHAKEIKLTFCDWERETELLTQIKKVNKKITKLQRAEEMIGKLEYFVRYLNTEGQISFLTWQAQDELSKVIDQLAAFRKGQ